MTDIVNYKSQAIHNAADALRQILNKLPIDKPASNEHTDTHIQHISSDTESTHAPHQQYEIPNDPSPPPFRPLAPIYGAPPLPGHPSPPVSSITHTQIITTAYGAPITDFQKTGTTVDVDTSSKWYNVPIGPGISQAEIGSSDPHNMYHVMSLKKVNENVAVKHLPQSILPPLPPSNSPAATYLPVSPTVQPTGGHQLFSSSPPSSQYGAGPYSHEYVSNFGPGYEIQPSIGYELLTVPHLQHGQRRLIKVRRSNRRH